MVWKRENPQTQGRSAFFINPITTNYFVVQKGATGYFKMNINDMILWIKKHNLSVERDNKSMFSTSLWFLFCGEGPMQALEVTNNRRNLMNSIALSYGFATS